VGKVDLSKTFVITKSRVYINTASREESTRRQRKVQEERVEIIETKPKPKAQIKPKEPKETKEPKQKKSPKRDPSVKKERPKSVQKQKTPRLKTPKKPQAESISSSQARQTNARLEAMKARILFNQKQKCDEKP